MQYRQLGHTDVDVSVICLGTMTFGEQNTEGEAHEQLDYAVEQGVNFIDTAEMYPVPPRAQTQGLTEAYIGSWLAKRGGRDELVLATKAAGPAPDWLPYLRGGPDLTRAHLEQALEASLKRLQTDYIDLYQIHWPARNTNFFGSLGYVHEPDEQSTPIEETLSVLGDFIRQGKVRFIGLSNETPWGVLEYLRLSERLDLPRVVSIQNPYNLLNRSFEVGLAEIAHREAVGLLAYSPLAFGMLSGKYLGGLRPAGARLTLFDRFVRYSNPEGEAATERYVALAGEHGLTPSQMALAYVNSRPFVTSNIIGATSMAQLREDIASIEVGLSDTVLQQIEAIHVAQPNPCP